MLQKLPQRTSWRTHLHVPLKRSTLQSRPYTLEQGFVVERFRQEFDRSCSQCLHSHFFVAVCSNKNDRNPAAFGVYFCRAEAPASSPSEPVLLTIQPASSASRGRDGF